MSEQAHTPRRLLAFSVIEETEGTGGIVFAKTNAQARRQGACEFGDGDFDSVTARRAPWADQYAEGGHVPVRAYLDAGWFWICRGCDRRMSDGEEFEGEPDWTVDNVVEPRPGHVFHSEACRAADEAYHAERVRRQDRAIERFKGVVRRRFPDVAFTEKKVGGLNPQHAHAQRGMKGWQISQVVVTFDFPGMSVGPASLRYDRNSWERRSKPAYFVPNGDREAFEAYAAIARASPSKSGGK